MAPDLLPDYSLDEGAVTLDDVLDTVREFGMASRELVAWELALDGGELALIWDEAVVEGLLRPAEDSGGTGEQMYVLTGSGQSSTRASAPRQSAA